MTAGLEDSLQKRLQVRLREQLHDCGQMGDEQLHSLIDEALQEAAQQEYLPLRRRLELKRRLFDGFRRLDILQELVDNPEITENKAQVKQTEHEIQWLASEINTKKLTEKNIAEYKHQIKKMELEIAFNGNG